jgi:MFS family permease
VTTPAERGGALGFTDLLVSAASAVGGLGGGLLLDLASFRSLTIVVAAALIPVLLVVAPLREREPGEFVPAEGRRRGSRGRGTRGARVG